MILKSYMNFLQNLKPSRCTEMIHHVDQLVLVCVLTPVLVHVLDVQVVRINVRDVARVPLHVLARVHHAVDVPDSALVVAGNVLVVRGRALMVARMLVKADVV